MTERYAVALRDGAECGGTDPLWPALARLAGVEADEATGFLAEDLSNTVVVLDGAAVLKLYRLLEPGPHPEPELLAALDGLHAPRLLGRLDRDGSALLVVQSLVPGEQVGWEPLIARLASGDGAHGEPAALARVTATLHRALARALGVREGGSAPLPPVELGGELATLAPRVAAGLAPLARPGSMQRVHGDLHVAQFLRGADGLVVVDWEGEPGLTLADRARPRPALRDLATLRLSLAHAACAAARRSAGFDWQRWASAARTEALSAYAAIAGDVDRDLLLALELEKELTELAYAERWLPEWLYAPRAVLPYVLEEKAP